MKPVVKRFCLLAVILLVVCPVLMEVLLRTAAATKPQNDYANFTWGHKVVKNSFGFREREVRPKSPGTYRIMVIGDSLSELCCRRV